MFGTTKVVYFNELSASASELKQNLQKLGSERKHHNEIQRGPGIIFFQINTFLK